MDKTIITWEKIDNDIGILINKIKLKLNNSNKVHLLIPCRGGEIIGSLIKNSLDLSEDQVTRIKFSNLKYQTGEDTISLKEDGQKELLSLFQSISNKKETLLFVDDLIDSGLTIDYIQSLSNKFNISLLTSVLYTKEGKNKDKVNLYVEDLSDSWIVFPWEKFYI